MSKKRGFGGQDSGVRKNQICKKHHMLRYGDTPPVRASLRYFDAETTIGFCVTLITNRLLEDGKHTSHQRMPDNILVRQLDNSHALHNGQLARDVGKA